MKVIIDIPEWKYKSICEGVEASKRCGVVGIDPDIHKAIYNGTPLDDVKAEIEDLSTYMFDVYDVKAKVLQILDNIGKADMRTNRKNCEYRHENGNCLKVGGFCTSVDDEHCMRGKAESEDKK